ncbi:MAG: hypothetical protein EBZ16_05200 [Flavobacteriia bacterium]|nr:helix-loop-helix domain-containing protein [Cryomorphaceae bacterium]NCZ94908.1 hypothetical protein [Flavobacteriia bacterium]NDA07491.1 hypothetical protein [Flavobacteriia bacterium]NDA28248.1 hypothetical protein [Flavobacteriia bacterium]NDD19092.1 hypothetical protein [Flavobacteriia bacterium]
MCRRERRRRKNFNDCFILIDSIMPSGKKRKRHKMATHKRKKRLRKNRHKKK